MRISDWSSDVCSSDLVAATAIYAERDDIGRHRPVRQQRRRQLFDVGGELEVILDIAHALRFARREQMQRDAALAGAAGAADAMHMRSEAHTSELQSLMRISYAVFCLQKQTQGTLH